MTRSHLGAALRDGDFRALTRIPGYPSRCPAGPLPPSGTLQERPVGRIVFSPLVGGPIVPATRCPHVRRRIAAPRCTHRHRLAHPRLGGRSQYSPLAAGPAPRPKRSARKAGHVVWPRSAPDRDRRSRDVLEDMHELARPFFGRQPFVCYARTGMCMPIRGGRNSRDDLVVAPQIASAAVGLPHLLSPLRSN